jgi:hypothetical protein
VAARWQNLHLTTAFGCWRQAVADAAERAAAADAFARRLLAATVSDAFSAWRTVAARKAQLRRQESEVSGQQQRLYKELAYGGWKEVVQWQASKRAADAHWRQVVQRSVLAVWYQRAQKKAGYQKVRLLCRHHYQVPACLWTCLALAVRVFVHMSAQLAGVATNLASVCAAACCRLLLLCAAAHTSSC